MIRYNFIPSGAGVYTVKKYSDPGDSRFGTLPILSTGRIIKV
jgi:hypothetical protein